MRLDKALVVRGLVRSRTEAHERVTGRGVTVNGHIVARGNVAVDETDEILVARDESPRFVSRGGLKLDAALGRFDVDVAGLRCLDIGASTGGFTDCLLKRGAVSVCAIDVGHGQMAPALAADPRVDLREGVNARHLSASDFDAPFDLVVADLSFISLTLVIPAIVDLLRPGGRCVLLVKPQFEVGQEGLGKGGIVRDETKRLAALDRVADTAFAAGLREIGRVGSPIAGGDGNQEYLLGLVRSGIASGKPNEIG